MTGKTKTIVEVKDMITLLASEQPFVTNCFIEFDHDLHVNKIVIELISFEDEKHLRTLLKPYADYGYRIVFRKQKPIIPFDY